MDEDTRRTQRFELRLSPRERERLERLARERDTTMAEVIRQALAEGTRERSTT